MNFSEVVYEVEQSILPDSVDRQFLKSYFRRRGRVAWLDVAAAQGLAAGVLTALQADTHPDITIKLLDRHPAGENEQYRFQRQYAKGALLFFVQQHRADDPAAKNADSQKCTKQLDIISDLLFAFHWSFGEYSIELLMPGL